MNEKNKSKNNTQINKTYRLIAVAIGLLTIFVFYSFAYKWSTNEQVSNMKIYFISTVLFIAIVGICFGIYAFRKKEIVVPTVAERMLAGLFFVGMLVFFYKCYYGELDGFAYPSKYLRHNVNAIVYFIILIVLSLSMFFVANANQTKTPPFRGFFGVGVAFVQAWFMCSFNPFMDDLGRALHTDAYTNGIMTVIGWEPLEMYSNSIYGHYGLLYVLPVKVLHLFGLSYWNSIAISIGIFGFIAFVVGYWCISQMIDSDVIFLLAVLSNAVISFQIYYNQYYQVMPHRILFPALMIASGILVYRCMNSKAYRILMWLVAMLSIVWNTETGLVCALACLCISIYLDSYITGKYTFKIIGMNILFLLIALGGAFFMVNIYNLLVGGHAISVMTFIYPMFSTNYSIQGLLQVALSNPMNGYFLVIAMLLGVIGFFAYDTLKLRLTEKAFIAIMTSVVGLGIFSYYMNRAVTTNASIVALPFSLICAYICDISVLQQKNRGVLSMANAASFLTILVLTSMSLASVSSVGRTLQNKIQTTWETDSLNAFLGEANEKIPYDSVCYGPYATELCALLDRKNGIYISDWWDSVTTWGNVNPEAMTHLDELLKNRAYEHVVVYADQIGIYPDPGEYMVKDNYSLMSTVEYQGMVFEVYERVSR